MITKNAKTKTKTENIIMTEVRFEVVKAKYSDITHPRKAVNLKKEIIVNTRFFLFSLIKLSPFIFL